MKLLEIFKIFQFPDPGSSMFGGEIPARRFATPEITAVMPFPLPGAGTSGKTKIFLVTDDVLGYFSGTSFWPASKTAPSGPPFQAKTVVVPDGYLLLITGPTQPDS